MLRTELTLTRTRVPLGGSSRTEPMWVGDRIQRMDADLLRGQIQAAEEALDLVRRVDERTHAQLIPDLEALLAEKRQALRDLEEAEKAEDHSDRAA
jgi:hypothetical protein